MLDDLWRWFDVGGLKLDIAFWLDPLSMVMVLIITGVGGLIHIYSTGYMHDERSYWRFFGWLNLFTFAMLVLVLGDNLWLMFVGWEGRGAVLVRADRFLVHGSHQHRTPATRRLSSTASATGRS